MMFTLKVFLGLLAFACVILLAACIQEFSEKGRQ
jgi:hypothetical protein